MPNSAVPDRDTCTVTDPVTGFVYPEAWVRESKNPALLELVRSGLAVLTSSGKILRRGYTTGTTAAAACKAAVLSLKNPVDAVEIDIPCGMRVIVSVEAREGSGSARKYAGDYPGDATAGMYFIARAVPGEEGIILTVGEGIGRFARDTPRHSEGEPAISHSALQSILHAIHEAMEDSGVAGVQVDLSAPQGASIAENTLNPKVGVMGGISVLGTTGLVEPWDDHLTDSMLERVAAADRVVLTTGRLGLRFSRLLFPDHEAVLVGAHIGEGLKTASGEVILCGLPGLIMKHFIPDILEGTGCYTVEELSGRPDFGAWLDRTFLRAREMYPGLRVVVLSRDGDILGDSG